MGCNLIRKHVSRPGYFTNSLVCRGFATLLVLCPVCISGWQPSVAATYAPAAISPPKPLREFRGVWVATFANIDWPSTNAVTTAQQKSELLSIMDRAVELKLNTIIFQVRPACDALYASALEPWSEYLTGTMGKAPEPFYDPLAFAIEEAHKRGLELHAWFNPYRARSPLARSPASANHISKTHPELVRSYGKSMWLDPGEKAVQDYSLGVVMDVLKRYDVDGVHFDDYFYPYKEQDASGRELDFPDESSWRRFGAGAKLARDDWRRQNVDEFVSRVYRSIKDTKPWVKFGISPFGIWRPGHPPQIQGLDAYAKLYADSRKWLANGWLDYFAPQLYWAISPPEHSFPALLKWWAEQNPQKRHLLAGMDATKTSGPWKPQEIVSQIALTRKQSGTSGYIFWGMRTLMRSGALDSVLEREGNTQTALVPCSPWLSHAAPGKPILHVGARSAAADVSWSPCEHEPVRLWVFQTRTLNEWRTQVLPGSKTSLTLQVPLPEAMALTAIDRFGNASRPAVLSRNGR